MEQITATPNRETYLYEACWFPDIWNQAYVDQDTKGNEEIPIGKAIPCPLFDSLQ